MTTKRSAMGAIAALLAAGFLALFMGTASAQSYTPTGTLTLSAATATQGGSVTATAIGCASDTPVSFVLNSGPIDLGTVNSGATGEASLTFQVPTTLPAGGYTITSTCLAPDGQTLVLSTTLNITAPGTSSPTTSTLPRTGSDNTNLLRAGVLLVAAGGAVVLVTRKRSQAKVDA